MRPEDEKSIVSKVLIKESDEEATASLRLFFKENNLVGLLNHSADVFELLDNNTDLGAVFLSEEMVEPNGMNGLELGLYIHKMRPELPIFLRRETHSNKELADGYKEAFSGYYCLDTLDHLKECISEHLFSMYYPMPLIRGIQEISNEAFTTTLSGIDIKIDPPYLVKDQIIYGELLSLIPLESPWCKGFMMLQTTQSEIMKMVEAGKSNLSSQQTDFRDVNGLLNEITNMIWGGIKSRFFRDESDESQLMAHKIQVPILVNHNEKYISFGTQEPQLCFKYTIIDSNNDSPFIVVYQKLVFNLNWNPDKFQESNEAVEDLVDSGELEFF